MATAKDAHELKQQGVIEAAANPETSVSPEDAEKEILNQARNAGVPAFSFDPDAPPEVKRAQIKAEFGSDLGHHHRPKGAAVVTDVDDGTGPDADLPEPSKAGALDIVKDENGVRVPDSPVLGDDDAPFTRTGWAPRIGWPADDPEEVSLLDHTTWVESKLPDHLYGDWYHNTGVIIFACLSSWLIAVFGGGIGWVILVMATCGTYYRTSLRRVRRNFRDDIRREMALRTLETDNESLEWINSFLVKFWPIYQPVLAQTVINSVDQVLSSATPSFLDSLKLKEFTLGSKPPRMEHVKTYPKTEDNVVMMDWKFSFMPNDVADMTARQIKYKFNPKVVLEIRIGKAMVSKGLDVIVEDMAFSGLMRLKIKLQTLFPHIDRIEMCFLERPTIDYVCKPLGGDSFGFDINFIPGLETFILEQIHGNLAPMMYAPNVFPIEVAKMLAGSPVDQAVGVVAVTLHGAQGLKNSDAFGGTIDPYAVLSLNRRQELARTKVIHDTNTPRWNETHYIIVTTFNEPLTIQVFDHNDFRKHKELGTASFPLEDLEQVNVYENGRLDVIADGKPRGVITADLRFFPVLTPMKNEQGKEEPPPESNQGILRFTVEQAKELDTSKSMVGAPNPYAVMYLNGKEIHQTKRKKRTAQPIWDDGSKEILIFDRKKAKLGVTVKDDRDIAGDQILGKYQIKLDDLLECTAEGKDYFSLSGVSTGKIKMAAQWKPVAISGVASAGGYVTPIGVMRFHFKKATDLRNFEAFGKSDPYTRVLQSGIEKARTVTFRNDLNPEWDEVLYIPVHSARDRLTLEVMDTEKVGKDRSLGQVDVFAGDYIEQDENGEFLVNDKKTLRETGLRLHGKGMVKGTLVHTIAFYPCLNIADPEDENEEEVGDDKKISMDQVDGDPPRASEDSAMVRKQRSSEAGKFNASLNKQANNIEPPTPTTVGRPSTTSRPSLDVRKTLPKIRLSPEELLKYESGLLIFRLMEAEMPESQSHLEVFVDDMAYPSYVSSTSQTRSHKFEEIGDCFIRELDFSRLTLKARKKGDDEDNTLASLQGNTLETLKQCLNNPTTLKLRGEDGRQGSVKVSLKYIPVKMDLDPSESINNMGQLRVDVLDATDLPSADRNGKSDPYCKFELNGQDVYKTKVQKKTLTPVWNEYFEINVPSRTAAQFGVTVWDYDFADKPDLLGRAQINLESLDPFKPSQSQYMLDGKSGSIRIRLLFRPSYVQRQRQGTSTFAGTLGGTGRMVTGIAGAPIKGGTVVAGVVGSGVGKSASFLRRGLFGKKDTNSSEIVEEEPEEPEEPVAVPNGGKSANGGARKTPVILEDGEPVAARPLTSNGHARSRSIGNASIHSTHTGAASQGTASFTVVKAAGFPPASDLYIIITQIMPKEKVVGKTKHYKSPVGEWQFDETFKFPCSPDAQFKIEAKGDHRFSSDDDLGEHVYFVDESGAATAKDLPVGSGLVTLKSAFQPAEPSPTDSPKAHIRRSFLSLRHQPHQAAGKRRGARHLEGPDIPQFGSDNECLGFMRPYLCGRDSWEKHFSPLDSRGGVGVVGVVMTLVDMYKKHKRVPLGHRIHLARALTTAVEHVHRVGWVHKSIRSDNIVFAPAKLDTPLTQDTSSSSGVGEDGYGGEDDRNPVSSHLRPNDLGNPVLFGFEYARAGDEATYLDEDYTQAKNLYRTPERWGKPTAPFKKSHDVYSLGVVLLEVALWKDVESTLKSYLDKQKVVPGEVAQLLMDKCAHSLSHQVGAVFAQCVLTCLEAFDQ